MLKAGVIVGLVGGALDFIAASTIYPAAYPGLAFARIWQSVAGGGLSSAFVAQMLLKERAGSR